MLNHKEQLRRARANRVARKAMKHNSILTQRVPDTYQAPSSCIGTFKPADAPRCLYNHKAKDWHVTYPVAAAA